MPDLIPTILLILFGFSLFVLLGNIAYSWRHKVTVERAVPPRGT